MSWTRTGTVSLTNGSPLVYGAVTAWASGGVTRAGDIFKAPDKNDYEVLSVQSNTQLTLTTPYLGVTASAQPYGLIHTGLLPAELAISISDLQSKYLKTVSQLYEWETSTEATVPMTNPATGVTTNVQPINALILSSTAAGTSNVPAGNVSSVTVQAAINELDDEKQPRDANIVSAAPGSLGDVLVSDGSKWVGQALVADASAFYKSDPKSPAFSKTSAATLSVKAGSAAKVFGVMVSCLVDTAVIMPALAAGNDYAVYVCTDGTIRADASQSAPTGYTTLNSRKIGGFHYGLVAAGTTVAGGSFNAAGSPTTGGMVWTQGDVDKIAGIDAWSIWDLKYRPSCPDPRGFSRIGNMGWLANYICSTDPDVNGISKAGTNIASGTVLPKVPLAMGGNGVLTYSALDWWAANEIVRAFGCRLPTAAEFYIAAFGVTENQSIDATASTYPVTQRNAGYTSRYGIEQASGHHLVWGQDSAGSATAWVANGGRGQSINNSIVRVILGGARTFGSNSGSRCSGWNNVSSGSYWYIGLRAAADHLQLA